MASMFDDVADRYALLNQLMTLGRDRGWRRALARAVPADAHVVLDLCTGDGASLEGLRRPGRLVVGVDVSFGMLEQAALEQELAGWAPRLVNGDAFRLPLREASLDAVTVAFGIRNLRPTGEALAEVARVLRPGGTLAVLEATAPRRGLLAPLHRFHLKHVVPALGRLSPDPGAYRYLAESILGFGDGSELEAVLAKSGFEVRRRRSFLLGAARLWAASREVRHGEKPPATVQRAWAGESGEPRSGVGSRAVDREEASWTAAQAAVSAALTAALVWGLGSYSKLSDAMPLEPWQRLGGWVLLGAGTVFAALRTIALVLRIRQGPDRR